jgi:BCCT family betaine/carnitine transporter
MPHRYDTDYEVGRDNLQRYGIDIHHPVFWISSLLVLVFVIGTLILPGEAKVAFDGAKGWSIANFDC